MTIDSNTFGWIISTGIAVWIAFKYWKKIAKLLVVLGAVVFVLFVVQIKQVYDTVTFSDNNQKVKVETPVKQVLLDSLDSDSSGIKLNKIEIEIVER